MGMQRQGNSPVSGANPNSDNLPWYVRYMLGIGMIYLALKHGDSPVTSGWVLAFLYIGGLLMMYEVMFLALLAVLAWAFFGALAGIPTSIAVLIGAWMIANSNKK